MNHFLGEFECKLDAKNRMVLPAALKRQMPDVEREGLVINRGFEKNLVIYTRQEWRNIMEKLERLNPFDRKIESLFVSLVGCIGAESGCSWACINSQVAFCLRGD